MQHGGAAIASAPPAGASELQLHVPSPDWRDQVIYFAMIDRFADGDPDNNNQGAGEFDPADHRRYSGGDLAGLAARLDYVQDLGATALWITPPVAHRWWSPQSDYGGYHGYWGEHLMQVDAHFGSLQDYRALSDGLHRRGMYLVQDIVVNHMGNYFGYPQGWQAEQPEHGVALYPDHRGRSAPSQPPFDRNDARKDADREAAIYHWTPAIVDYQDPRQEHDWQMADLDDLNTENPAVRRALRESYGHWIREVGVDAFRVDTAFYVPPDYFRDFLYADDPTAPGMVAVARATGREDFLLFGEGFGIDPAGEDRQSRKIAGYLADAQGPLLPSMINFPLYGSLLDVFARGRPPQQLAERIDSVMRLFPDPHRLPTFVDNHDVDRFLAGGSEAALRQSLLLILTLPGIPTIYYGTEQGFSEQRAAMFASGYAAAGRDHFDRDAPLYRFLREAIALRRQHPLFSRGRPTVLKADAAGPGALAYRMQQGEDSAWVLFNTAEHPVLIDAIDTDLAAGQGLQRLFSLHPEGGDTAHVDAEGRYSRVLPARGAEVWRASARSAPAQPATLSMSLQAPSQPVQSGDFRLQGQVRGAERVLAVVDGRIDTAIALQPDAEGRVEFEVDTRDMTDAAVEHSVLLWSPAHAIASAPRRFKVAREWVKAAQQEDPAGDDHGPQGRYVYPTDPGWGDNRQLDLRGVRVSRSGGSLRLDLRMHRLTRGWSPANGFDRVAFTVFLELPGRAGGSRIMPLQHAELPEGMRWHYRLRAHGWSNVLFSSDGADREHEGRIHSPGAQLQVDAEQQTVSFVLPAAALDYPDSLRGARLYVTTWDYDAGFRALGPQPASHQFGGGGADDPRVMDASAVITLK